MKNLIASITDIEIYKEFLTTYQLSIAIFIGIIIIIKLIENNLLIRLEKLANKTKTDTDDFIISIIRKIGWPFYIAIALYFASQTISTLSEKTNSIIIIICTIIFTLYVFKLSGLIVDYAIEKTAKKYNKKGLTNIKTFSFMAKMAIWSFVLVIILSNYGYDLTSIITGLGIGGIAIGLALQNVLGDFFSGITILLDKPFEIGDVVKIGDQYGTIKSIGIKTTRLTLLDGPELIITNKDLTESRVHNFKKLKKRREIITLGVTYNTKLKTLKEIPKLIKQAFNNVKEVELSRVHLIELGHSSKNFEIVYHINNSDYDFYRNVHQQILLNIVELFEKEKIEFAFPTQTLYVKQD